MSISTSVWRDVAAFANVAFWFAIGACAGAWWQL
jgi:hypothetical protein